MKSLNKKMIIIMLYKWHKMIIIDLFRILFGIILIIASCIGYIIGLTISFLIIMQISIVICTLSVAFYDIIRSLIIIMILGIYDKL